MKGTKPDTLVVPELEEVLKEPFRSRSKLAPVEDLLFAYYDRFAKAQRLKDLVAYIGKERGIETSVKSLAYYVHIQKKTGRWPKK